MPSPLLSIRISYRTSSPNWKKFGPPAGSSSGMKFERIVTFEVSTGSTNAYRSVLSATGSFEIVGASRWDDIGAHLAYVVRRLTSPGSLVTISWVPHITTTVPWAASFTYAMTGAFTSPGGGLAWTFSATLRIVGAAAIAPTAAAPTAVFCRKLRLDIFDSSPSGVREGASRTISGQPDRFKGYFDVCNIACYKWMGLGNPRPERVHGDRMSGRGFEPRTFGCPRSAAVRLRQNPMSPTLHQAEPPRRAGPWTER